MKPGPPETAVQRRKMSVTVDETLLQEAGWAGDVSGWRDGPRAHRRVSAAPHPRRSTRRSSSGAPPGRQQCAVRIDVGADRGAAIALVAAPRALRGVWTQGGTIGGPVHKGREGGGPPTLPDRMRRCAIGPGA
jgi:hypothetical protein